MNAAIDIEPEDTMNGRVEQCTGIDSGLTAGKTIEEQVKLFGQLAEALGVSVPGAEWE